MVLSWLPALSIMRLHRAARLRARQQPIAIDIDAAPLLAEAAEVRHGAMDMGGDDGEIGRLPEQVGPEPHRVKGRPGLRIGRGQRGMQLRSIWHCRRRAGTSPGAARRVRPS